MILTAPPKVGILGAILDGNFGRGSNDSSLAIYAWNENPYELSLAPDTLLFARSFKSAGTEYLLAGVVDTGGIFKLYRFHDVDADQLVDAATKTLVFNSGTIQMYVTDIAFGSTRWYLLDRRCQDVYLADASAGLPTGVIATPFAQSATYAELIDVRYLELDSAGALRGLSSRAPSDVEHESLNTTEITLSDTNADDLADLATYPASPNEFLRPLGEPYSGQTTFPVESYKTDTVEVWSLTSAGVEDVLLGSVASTGTNSAPVVHSVALSPSPSSGDEIRVRYAGDTTGVDMKVLDANPQLLEVQPESHPSDITGTITVKGLNLSSSMTIKAFSPTNPTLTPLTLTFTLTSTTEIALSVPAFGSAWEGQVILQATVSGQTTPTREAVLVITAP